MNLAIVRQKCPHAIYRHFDLNAGSGWNVVYDVPGTPRVFVELAEAYLGNKWQATFFEFDADRAAELRKWCNGIPRCRVLPIDNVEFRKHARDIGRWDVGSVLADPNGWLYRRRDSGAGCPVTEMMEFFADYPRIDLIANLNLRFYKNARGAMHSHPARPQFPGLYPLTAMPDIFRKRHGLISNISHNGHSSFIRLVLRNIRTNDYRAMGWNHLDSPAALKIYRYAETTARERATTEQSLLPLFEETR